MIDVEGRLASSYSPLPIFAGDLHRRWKRPPATRRMLLAMGVQLSGEYGPEIEQMLEERRRELRRLLVMGGLFIGPKELARGLDEPPP
jgi:hypothetical protein